MNYEHIKKNKKNIEIINNLIISRMKRKYTFQNMSLDPRLFDPLNSRFSLILDLKGRQSVTQGSMGRDPSRYPPGGPGLQKDQNSRTR